ncbi:alpha/beta hydrolase [Chitinophaga horti]|uniref:Alpha/beta hydrolase n=1 Tax=Chitinophaga horti TaxID=2920382 RepID=A0ABY6J1E5_9BACT|nr:alpha/beta hydrolase [Chitinophaga horti]UYQ93514.1 alpha/beta hydrolase [Chitinophaga horti]
MWKELNSGNHKGAYRDEGQGKVVLLLHGFGEDGSVWENQQAYLSNYFRVIVPDLPGSGKSPLADVSMEAMADFVHAILLQEKLVQVTMIGHSMGGYVTLAFADKHPEMLQGFGLFHSTALPDNEEKKEGRRKSIRMIEQYGADAFVRQTLPNMFAAAFREAQPQRVEEYIRRGLAADAASLIAYYDAMIQRPDRTAVLKDTKTPVLFIIGKDDTAVPPDSVLPQVTIPPVSSVHIFENVAHMGLWEVYEASNIILQQFVTFCQRS